MRSSSRHLHIRRLPLLLAAAGLAALLLLAWALGLFSGTEDDRQDLTLLAGGFSERQISDPESALAAIGDAAALIGISDPASELGSCRTDHAFGQTYYRFTQHYQGIPVYGRSLTLAVDSSDAAVALAGNYLPLANLRVTPELTEQEAVAAAGRAYQGAVTSEGLTIYSLAGHDPELAWQISVNNGETSLYCFISARNGSVIAAHDRIAYASSSGQGVDNDGVEQVFNTSSAGGQYQLIDQQRHLHVYNAGGGRLTFEYAIADSASRLYRFDTARQLWVDEDDSPVSFQGSSSYGDWSVVASHGETVGYHAYPVFSLRSGSSSSALEEVSSASAGWEDSRAVTLISRAADCYDFYQQVLGRDGFNGSNGETLLVYNSYANGESSAFSTSLRLSVATLLNFSRDHSLSLDAIAHEYTHSAVRSINGLLCYGEPGALLEAYADLFGELIEDYYHAEQPAETENAPETADGQQPAAAVDLSQMTAEERLDGSCDWQHDGGLRDLTDPAAQHQPSVYHGRFWADSAPDARDNGGVHTNGSVISHAAYQMTQEAEGAQPLSVSQLTQLLYRTLFLMPADCNFAEFNSLLRYIAQLMVQEGSLENEQLLRVEQALDEAELPLSAQPCYAVTSQLTLTIVGADGAPAADYRITLTQGETSQEFTAAQIADSGLSLAAAGPYQLTVSDSQGRSETFLLQVSAHGSGQLTLTTRLNAAP